VTVIRSEADIDAPRELVWSILVDLPRYSEWNPFNVRMESTLQIGAPVEMRVRMMGGLFRYVPGGWYQRQVEYVRSLEPGRKVCWGDDTIAGGRVTALRCQWLEDLPGGRTRYVNEDDIGGPLAQVVVRFFGSSMQVGFDRTAEALKARAEAAHGGEA